MSSTPTTTNRTTVERVLEDQRAYEKRRSTRFGRGAERVTAPLSNLIARIVPPEMVQAALRLADKASGLTVPSEVTSHDINDLDACEAAARRVQAWSQGTNAATGGAAGWFGAAGLTADISATIGLAARNVRATGAAYGFTASSQVEETFRLAILEVATSIATDRREQSLEGINDLARKLNDPKTKFILDKGGEWVTEKLMERIARKLGVSLAGRKAGQVVPIIGGAVGATVNASFQVDVSRAARYAYRQRWLMERKMISAPLDAAE
jgi:hypothetical protein